MAQGPYGDVLQQLREQVDIVEVINGYLSLDERGKEHLALCPFHKEKTPSFTVNREKAFFYCFGCGATGDALKFLQLINNISFPESVQMLAERFGVRLPQRRGGDYDAAAKERQQLIAVNELAQDFFHRVLLDEGQSKAGNYLNVRGISQATVEQFRLGYAPDSWDALLRFASSRGFDPRLLAEAGLIKERSSGSGYYDRFRSRLMFPVRNVDGRVVGFGGRLLEEEEQQPKYLNTPETSIYRKSAVLYGFFQARDSIRRMRRGVLVEGYFDVLSCHQRGVDNVVATCGTALTEGHVKLLKRFTTQVAVAFDADAAGRRAASRGEALFLDHGLRVTVVRLPVGEDPDSFVRGQGAEAFQDLVESAPPLLKFLIDLAIEGHGKSTAEARTDVIREVLGPIAKIQDNLERSDYVDILAQRLNVSSQIVFQELRRQAGHEGGQRDFSASKSDPKSLAERQLIAIMLQHPDRVGQVREALRGATFQFPQLRALAELLFRRENLRQPLDLREILPIIAADDLRQLAVLLAREPIAETGTSIDELILQYTDYIDRREGTEAKQNLRERLREAENAGRMEEVSKLMEEMNVLLTSNRVRHTV